eukprot:6672787-Alexandrium_andersonii.AAC.1
MPILSIPILSVAMPVSMHMFMPDTMPMLTTVYMATSTPMSICLGLMPRQPISPHTTSMNSFLQSPSCLEGITARPKLFMLCSCSAEPWAAASNDAYQRHPRW